ncbi:MAG: hypothetical protein OXU73_02570 [Candidatus Campbellbacteria bacterium]|nr:hypothetical protein [Candidatus Campbellbacteria bacterium]
MKKDRIYVRHAERNLAKIFLISDGFAITIPNSYLKNSSNKRWDVARQDGQDLNEMDSLDLSTEPKLSFHIFGKEVFIQISGRGITSGRNNDGTIKGIGMYVEELELEYFKENGISLIAYILNFNINDKYKENPKKGDFVYSTCNDKSAEKLRTAIFLTDKDKTGIGKKGLYVEQIIRDLFDGNTEKVFQEEKFEVQFLPLHNLPYCLACATFQESFDDTTGDIVGAMTTIQHPSRLYPSGPKEKRQIMLKLIEEETG